MSDKKERKRRHETEQNEIPSGADAVRDVYKRQVTSITSLPGGNRTAKVSPVPL